MKRTNLFKRTIVTLTSVAMIATSTVPAFGGIYDDDTTKPVVNSLDISIGTDSISAIIDITEDGSGIKQLEVVATGVDVNDEITFTFPIEAGTKSGLYTSNTTAFECVKAGSYVVTSVKVKDLANNVANTATYVAAETRKSFVIPVKETIIEATQATTESTTQATTTTTQTESTTQATTTTTQTESTTQATTKVVTNEVADKVAPTLGTIAWEVNDQIATLKVACADEDLKSIKAQIGHMVLASYKTEVYSVDSISRVYSISFNMNNMPVGTWSLYNLELTDATGNRRCYGPAETFELTRTIVNEENETVDVTIDSYDTEAPSISMVTFDKSEVKLNEKANLIVGGIEASSKVIIKARIDYINNNYIEPINISTVVDVIDNIYNVEIPVVFDFENTRSGDIYVSWIQVSDESDNIYEMYDIRYACINLINLTDIEREEIYEARRVAIENARREMEERLQQEIKSLEEPKIIVDEETGESIRISSKKIIVDTNSNNVFANKLMFSNSLRKLILENM